MSAADLGLGGAAGVARILLGAALFLLPGLAAADRLLGLRRHGWMFAPVFSFTVLPLGAILLDLALHVKVARGMTVALALGWTVVLAWPRLRALRGVRRERLQAWWQAQRTWRPTWRAPALLVVLAFVGLVQALPHLPGSGDSGDVSAVEAYPEALQRWQDGAAGNDIPYPVHVDEHNHLAQQAAIERQGTIDVDDPYTGEPSPTPLFSVQGFRQERGFDLALVQLHHLTGMELVAQARFVPPLQAMLLAGLAYATLAPARGALLSAAFVAFIPTTLRFLGPGFLVPSAFALPWILTALHVSLRAEGGRRLAALALLETAGFFLHLVLGTLVILVAALGALLRPGRTADRAVLVAVTFLPLVWIGPLVAQQVAEAVGQEHALPFQPGIFLSAGVAPLVLAQVGAVIAVLRQGEATRPHIALAALAAFCGMNIALSLTFGHRSDATYSRLIPTLFLCLAALTGLALGQAGAWLGRYMRTPSAGRAAAGVVAVLVLAPALASHLSTPYYRVFDDASWQDGRILEESGASQAHRFLADPWRAPVYNSLTGAIPHAVLYPGTPPENGADWAHYLRTEGASADWLAQRGIDYVVAPYPPKAPHDHVGGNVYRLKPAA